MLDHIQMILAIIDHIVELAIAGNFGAQNHVKTALLESKPFGPRVWRSLPIPDV